MDPQQRLLLEVTWETLNDAGRPPESLSDSSTGVFFAVYNTDYARLQFSDPATIGAHTSSGTSHGVAAGRLSYLLNLHGPSMAIDTACSSSLVAVHLACQSLRIGECSLALAGGVSTLLTPEETISLSKWGMLAPDGRCKTFDAAADGFVRGEGCGIVALKRLADALADGDRVHAVIRGSAVNQDGRSTALTAPNGLAQEKVLRQALQNARLTGSQLSYVEAHGTGTALGDPIEVEALAAVMGQPRRDGSVCRLGSVKTNLGHLEGAAGVAGLIKVVLSMEHQTIPPHLHFKKLNPLISLEGTCLAIGSEAVPWPREALPRCAGVSSFGFGGTNAHVVLEEAPRLPVRTETKPESNRSLRLLPISARSGSALVELAREYVGFLSDPRWAVERSIEDICYTASLRRWHYPVRAAFSGATSEELATRIQDYLEQTPTLNELAGKPGKLIFVFSGHGSQWAGMGRSLFEQERLFRESIAASDEVLQSISGWSVLEELKSPEDRSRLDETEIFQPVLFAIQVALAALWRSWGIAPEAVLGHSVGEIAAAYVAGAIRLEEAARIVVHRARVMQTASGHGGMVAVEISAVEAKDWIAERKLDVTIAAINGPRSITLSGPVDAIDRCFVELSASGILGRKLKVDCAFHSPTMFPCAESLAKAMAGLTPVDGTIPFYSAVEGRILEGHKLDASYWGRNVSQPVQFASATATAIRAGYSLFLELSPHPVLASPVRQSLSVSGTSGAVMGSMRRGQVERTTMLDSLGSLYKLGRSIEWKALNPGSLRCVSLPPYPWQRERYWFTPTIKPPADDRQQDGSKNSWPGRYSQSAFFDGVMLESEISATEPEFVHDHRVLGVAVIPATAMIDLALTAAHHALIDATQRTGHPASPARDGNFLQLENFAIDQGLAVADKERRVLQLGFKPATPDSGSFQLFSRKVTAAEMIEPWTLHASGSVQRVASMDESHTDELDIPTLERAKKHCREEVDVELHYQTMWKRGIEFGPLFRGVEALWRGPRTGLARIRAIGNSNASPGRKTFDPTLLDSCLQAIAPALPENLSGDGSPYAYLPLAIDRLRLSENLSSARWSFAQIREANEAVSGLLVADIWLFDDAGQTSGVMQGLRLQRTERSQLEQLVRTAKESWLYELCWEPQPLPLLDGTAKTRFDKRCLVFADGNGIAGSFAERLSASGAKCVFVVAGDGFRRSGDSNFEVAPGVAKDFHELLAELRRGGQWPVQHIVHFWGLDLPSAASNQTKSLSEEQVLSFGSVLHLVQALNSEQAEEPPRIWLATRAAASIRGEESIVEPAQSAAWGLGRVVALEHPEYRCTTVDLHGDNTLIASSLDQLCHELRADASEDRLILATGQRLVARLRPLERPQNRTQSPSALPSVALESDSSGVLEQLRWRPCQRRAPAGGEVEIEVNSAGLNFRDVLTVLKMVKGRGQRLGGECSGRVLSVGLGVHDFQIGDEVMAFALGGMASHVIASTDLVIRKPAALSLEQSAALPVVFLTALYAFRRVRPLLAGQRILIHAAAGGVGSAAVQLAKLAGAEIFGTAGSPEKRTLLKSWGVEHVFDSRSVSFADEIRAVVGDRGIDVVLNSLSGDFAMRSLELVRPGGAFIELGKRDLLEPQEVRRNYPGVSYTAFDLADLSEQQPEIISSLFTELKTLLESEVVQLPPMQVFPAQEIASAFRQMAQGRHTGKIVIHLKEEERGVRTKGPFGSDGVWVITGGLGGLGLRLARWLATQGVTRLALIGRHPPNEEADKIINELRGTGNTIEACQTDVTNQAQLGQLLDGVRKRLGPLRGIVHAAGVLDDGAIAQMNWPRSRSVLSPKMDGAWNLHQLTSGDGLEAFVLFSSGASVFGSPGQGNYAAANAFLDALALHRHGQGLPALSINWGAWEDAGMSANLVGKHRARLAARGLRPIALDEGFAVLGELLKSRTVQVVAVPADWSQYVRQLPNGASSSVLRNLVDKAAAFETKRSDAEPAVDFLATCSSLPPRQRLGRVQQLVEVHATRALGLTPGKPVDPRRSLQEMGLDSLMSVELRNALAALLGRSLPATLVFDYPTIESLGLHLAKDILKLELGESVLPEESLPLPNKDLKELQEISEDEAELLLVAELERSKRTTKS
jgi:polyketide synthase 12